MRFIPSNITGVDREVGVPAPRLGRRPAPAAGLDEPLGRLRAAVTELAGRRRAEGAALEDVVAEVDGLVARAEALAGSPDELGILLRQVRRWSLEAYLDEPALQNVPRFY
jgi:hypothetical protein